MHNREMHNRLTAPAILWQTPVVARKLKIENPGAAHPVIPRGRPRAPSSARRHPLWIARNLPMGSRPNLAPLPSRIKR
jgi:hypothetical protein